MKTAILKKAKTIKRLTSKTLSRIWGTKSVKESISINNSKETESTSQSSSHVYFQISPMNKSLIVQHSSVKLILKLRNISKNMRKRVKYNLRNKKVIISEARVCNGHVINGWADYSENYLISEDVPCSAFIKGVSSYLIREEEDKIQIQRLNGSLRARVASKFKTKPASYEYINLAYLRQNNFDSENEVKNQSTYKIIEELRIFRLSPIQIKNAFKNIENVRFLKIIGGKLGSLNLSSSSIQKVRLCDVTIEGLIQFPWNTSTLTAEKCNTFHLIKCPNLTVLKILLNFKLSEQNQNWIKSLDSLKELQFKLRFSYQNEPKKHFPNCFPSNLKHLSLIPNSIIDLDDLAKTCPNLICLDSEMNVSDVERMQPKSIVSELNDDVFGPITSRPRIIRLSPKNIEAVMNHPEILKEVKKIELNFALFDLRRIPVHIKHIVLVDKFKIGCSLNRPLHKHKSHEKRVN